MINCFKLIHSVILQYLAGDFLPGKYQSGGFLDFQAAIYSHIFNTTGIRSFDYAGAPYPLNVTLPTPDGPFTESSMDSTIKQERKLDDDDNASEDKGASTTTTKAPVTCLSECVDRHVNGEPFCNKACMELYVSDEKNPPMTRYKDAKHIQRLFRSCMYMPANDDNLEDCSRALYGAACTACSRLDAVRLRMLLEKLYKLKGKNSSAELIELAYESAEDFWSQIYDFLIGDIDLDLFTTPDLPDILSCIGTILWINHVENKTDLLELVSKFGLPVHTKRSMREKYPRDDDRDENPKVDENRLNSKDLLSFIQNLKIDLERRPGIDLGGKKTTGQSMGVLSEDPRKDEIYQYSPVTSDFLHLVFDRQCASFQTVIFTDFTMKNAAYNNPYMSNSTYPATAYLAAQILGNLFSFGKVEHVSDRILPIKFT